MMDKVHVEIDLLYFSFHNWRWSKSNYAVRNRIWFEYLFNFILILFYFRVKNKVEMLLVFFLSQLLVLLDIFLKSYLILKV